VKGCEISDAKCFVPKSSRLLFFLGKYELRKWLKFRKDVPDGWFRALSRRWFFQNNIASIRRKRCEHDYAAHWHSVIRAGVTPNSPVQFACVYFCRCLPFIKSLIHHTVQFCLEVITCGHEILTTGLSGYSIASPSFGRQSPLVWT
jgi:hypothetical protein